MAQQLTCSKVVEQFVITPELDLAKDKINEGLVYLWAMGGDFVSKHYSGTNSVLTKITLKGHQNVFDKIEQNLISIKRFQK